MRGGGKLAACDIGAGVGLRHLRPWCRCASGLSVSAVRFRCTRRRLREGECHRPPPHGLQSRESTALAAPRCPLRPRTLNRRGTHTTHQMCTHSSGLEHAPPRPFQARVRLPLLPPPPQAATPSQPATLLPGARLAPLLPSAPLGQPRPPRPRPLDAFADAATTPHRNTPAVAQYTPASFHGALIVLLLGDARGCRPAFVLEPHL